MNIGDYLVCIDNRGCENNLIKNRLYIYSKNIDYFDHKLITVLDLIDNEMKEGFYLNRFRLALPEEIEYYKFPDKLEKLVNSD